MAHFAQLDNNNIVTNVLIVNNEELLDENGNESEEIGRAKLESLHGGRWIQTSYNHRFRHRYAGIGMIYNEECDVFAVPQPFPSWTFNTETYGWEPPVPVPQITDDQKGRYLWNEDSLNWIYTED